MQTGGVAFTLTIDCGGGGIKGSVLDEAGTMRAQPLRVPTPYPLPPDLFVKTLVQLGERLPSADALDRLAYRVTIVAFPVYTFAVVAGAIWAEAAWGRFWGWDPKETVAFVAWVVYAAYLHARTTAGWRGRPAAWINVVGLGVMIFNLLFVNLVSTGMHSYAGVS